MLCQPHRKPMGNGSAKVPFPVDYLIAECGVSVHQAQDVTVNAAPGGELGKDGRLHLFLPLLDDHLTGLPLAHHLLIPCCDLLVNLQGETKNQFVCIFPVNKVIEALRAPAFSFSVFALEQQRYYSCTDFQRNPVEQLNKC